MPKVTIDRFLSAVTAGSSCLSEPAAALRGFAKGDSPRSSRSSLSDRNEDSGMNISPMASSSAGGSSTISRSGTAGMVRKFVVAGAHYVGGGVEVGAEGGRRANVLVLGADPRTGGFSFAPLFDWKNDDVEAYIAKNGLPMHPLYDKSFRSIGCYPCTTPVEPGEDDRAGRWRHLQKPEADDAPKYCRINFSDGI